ncbi:MAG TPA: zinc ABC transporter substrate-binding protein, partial [Tepidisphaeraceae bacterium]|nr:zinc ABC transporter substrate-binding protein [Tepidisphaeraceae bacterium]
IGGDDVDLTVLIGPGVDPHTFKPSPADVASLKRADLIFYNGLHLEGKMVDLFEQTLKERSTAVTADVPPNQLLGWKGDGSDASGGAHDPHLWFDVKLWGIAARTIERRLTAHDPTKAAAFKQRGDALAAELAALDGDVRQKLATIPAGRRVLVTSHDAYNYFAKAYDIEVFGLQGISTETEAGLANVGEAVRFIRERKIPAIFVESSVSPKTIERVRDDVRAAGGDVVIPGELYSDALGAPGDHPGYDVHTYAGAMRYNVDLIVKALK